MIVLPVQSVVAMAMSSVPLSEVPPASPIKIGFIVLSIIVVPVIVLITASVLGHPKTLRVPGLFLGGVFLLISALIIGFAVIGAVTGLVVPQ